VPGSLLTNRRRAAGRAIAIRGAILAGLDRGDSPARIEAAIWSASAAGVPGGQARLLAARRRARASKIHRSAQPPVARIIPP
jgi:hypothetical protein